MFIGNGMDGTKLSVRNLLAGQGTKPLDGASHSEVEIGRTRAAAVVASITNRSAGGFGIQAGYIAVLDNALTSDRGVVAAQMFQLSPI